MVLLLLVVVVEEPLFHHRKAVPVLAHLVQLHEDSLSGYLTNKKQVRQCSLCISVVSITGTEQSHVGHGT